jgi:AraC family ethanolamine operon transcriptional activator
MQTTTFTDFDAFAETVTDVDCEMTLLNPRRQRWTIGQIDLPQAHVQWGKEGSGNITEGQSWHSRFLLFLPLSGSCPYSINGSFFERGSALIIEPGSEFCLSSKEEHDWFAFSIPTSLIENQLSVNAPADAGRSGCRVSSVDPRLTDRLESAITDLILFAGHAPDFGDSPAATVAQAQLIEAASALINDSSPDLSQAAGRPKLSRRHIIRMAKNHMEEQPRNLLSCRDLAVAVGVSERTLRDAFRAYFGVGPARYMKLRQLNQVHRELKTASPDDETVSKILLRHGIWEHGRFAGAYHRLFGETPSTTLRSGKG